ncbi:MAG: ornithine cyclodeaminase, partial [Candidatus Marinimicrobia bacterium]|nr:ornithine cyclodeaminase [Candidatus Neomarinimicrobiota bacterium]
TIEHIGELTIPISNGIISKNDIIGDFYDLIPSSKGGRKSNDEITIFKNGGGAHLDLMIAKYLIEISNNSIS